MNLLKFVNSYIVMTSRIICNRGCIEKSNPASLFSATRMPKKSKETRKYFCTDNKSTSVTSVYLQVIGSGADGVPGCVMLVTNYGSYLINCGEGTMKLASEYRIKVHKSQNVFITYPSWDNISGLMGFALAVQEARSRNLCIHGDSDIGSMFSIINKFVNLRSLQVSVQSCSHYEEFSDGVVSVKYVFLYPSIKRDFLVPLDNEGESLDDKSKPDLDFILTKTKGDKNFSLVDSEKQSQQQRKSTQYAISYIFKTKESLGFLNFEKCIEYGVPPGPLLGQLKNGNDVTLENGNIVRSKDVKNPNKPGVSVIAVQCPTEDYLDCLLEESVFHEFQKLEDPAGAVIHFTSSKVVKNLKYQEWINRFPKTTLHLFINEENKRTGSVAIHRQQYKLNFLQPDIFPLLDDSGIPDFPRTKNSDIQNGHTAITKTNESFPGTPIYGDKVLFKCNDNPFIYGETLCQVQLKPKPSYDYSRHLVLKKEAFFKEIFESDEIREKIEESVKRIKAKEREIESDNKIYPKIVFLGTGSSKPSKVRNGSGILVYFSSCKCILLDCGESTYGQLISFYGKQKTREILRQLQAIYISHMHLDHQLGLISILKERKLAFDEPNEFSPQESNVKTTGEVTSKTFSPIYILAPTQLHKWLTWYSEKFEDISNLWILIPNSFLKTDTDKVHNSAEACKKNLDLKDIMTASVHHCIGSFGISMIHKDGYKITYSGDTKPCQALIDIGMNSDILIHEATLEDAYFREARIKQHSTTSQAIDVGKSMNAKYILLTHFSQRYCYLPNIDSSFSELNIGIAFDFMEVPFNKLPLLPVLIEPLQYIFSKYDEMNKSATKSLLLKKDRARGACFTYNDLLSMSGTPAKVLKSNF